MPRIVAAIAAVVLLFFGGKSVINLLSVNINLPPWQSSSVRDAAPAGAQTAQRGQPNRTPELVSYSAAMRLFNGDGKPLVWYYKDARGAIELYDAPGYHARTGNKLLPVTPEIAAELHRIAQDCVTFREEDGKGHFLGYAVDCDKDSADYWQQK